jgi:hypothetical protein
MEASARSEQLIHVRKVTNVHANWSAHERDQPGKFSFQLILDDGAEEYLVRPSVEAAKVLLKLLKDSKTVSVDMSRGVVIFSGVGD